MIIRLEYNNFVDNEDKFLLILTTFDNLFLDFWRNLSFIRKVLFSFSSLLISALASSSCSFNELLFYNKQNNLELSCIFEGRHLILGIYFEIILLVGDFRDECSIIGVS